MKEIRLKKAAARVRPKNGLCLQIPNGRDSAKVHKPSVNGTKADPLQPIGDADVISPPAPRNPAAQEAEISPEVRSHLAHIEKLIALGELKGGIDPAGADEHWKTARTALDRIRRAFTKEKLKVRTFFIGAAIEAKMAAEIWEMLQRGELENAANLTSDEHITSVANWLCNL